MSQPKNPKPLSVVQMLILRTGAERPDRMVLPLPSGVRARGASRIHLLASLLNASLVEEAVTSEAALSWRKGEDGALVALRITPAGFAAIGQPVSEQEQEQPAPAAGPDTMAADETPGSDMTDGNRQERPSSPAPSRPVGKLGSVLAALRAEGGATLVELVASTGWLPHTTRAALTGLRKRGYPVQLAERNGRKAYRLTEAG
jgi:hypothetical protein